MHRFTGAPKKDWEKLLKEKHEEYKMESEKILKFLRNNPQHMKIINFNNENKKNGSISDLSNLITVLRNIIDKYKEIIMKKSKN